MSKIKYKSNFAGTLLRSVNVDGTIIPAGTILQFGIEGFGYFKGLTIYRDKLPKGAIEMEELELDTNESVVPEGCSEGDGSKVAEAIIAIINDKYPDGFTESQFIEDFGDAIEGNQYSITEVDEQDTLIIKTETEAIEIYLLLGEDNRYRLTGEYHVASDAKMSAGVEALVGRMYLVATEAAEYPGKYVIGLARGPHKYVYLMSTKKFDKQEDAQAHLEMLRQKNKGKFSKLEQLRQSSVFKWEDWKAKHDSVMPEHNKWVRTRNTPAYIASVLKKTNKR